MMNVPSPNDVHITCVQPIYSIISRAAAWENYLKYSSIIQRCISYVKLLVSKQNYIHKKYRHKMSNSTYSAHVYNYILCTLHTLIF